MHIFERAGIPEVVSVASDSGMMGGSLSHEFMLLTPVGEDSIVLCNECDFRACSFFFLLTFFAFF